jgi:YD repeat-containing protein
VVTTNTYDNLGRVATTKQSSTVGGAVDYGTTAITYNGLGQPATVTGPGVLNPVTAVTHTTRATYSYDALGRRTSQAIADTTGGDATRTTAWQYDPAGRLTRPPTRTAATPTRCGTPPATSCRRLRPVGSP